MFKKIKEFRNWCKEPIWKAANGGQQVLTGWDILKILVYVYVGAYVIWKFVFEKIVDFVCWVIDKIDDWKQKHPKKEKYVEFEME